ELLGSIRLLWGRAYIEDEIARLQLRLYATPAVPPNPRALPLWLEAISRGVGPDGTETVADAACEEGLVPLALASRVAKEDGIAAQAAGYRAIEIQRVDLLPQTSRIHCVVAMERQ